MPLYGNHERLTWVYDGQPVIAARPDGSGVQGTVTKAAGHHAEFTSKDGTIRRWVDVTNLFPDDGRLDERTRQRKAAAKAGAHDDPSQ